MKDYYAILGLEQKATKAEIKKNYRQLANKFHPDKNSDPKAAPIFISITEAYDTLSNKKSRANYDLMRWAELKSKRANRESFQTYAPPKESTRSRRNKAQEKRSIKYHQAKTEVNKTLLLIWECLNIIGRYALLILAITLMLVIFTSAVSNALSGEIGSAGIGIGIAILAVVLLWGIIRICLHIFSEAKKDIPLFSIYYKITHKKALQYFLSVFVLALLVYFRILLFYA